MSAPNMVWIDLDEEGETGVASVEQCEGDIQFIRKDLVDDLRPYLKHENYCKAGHGKGSCTCGLTEVLKEME